MLPTARPTPSPVRAAAAAPEGRPHHEAALLFWLQAACGARPASASLVAGGASSPSTDAADAVAAPQEAIVKTSASRDSSPAPSPPPPRQDGEDAEAPPAPEPPYVATVESAVAAATAADADAAPVAQSPPTHAADAARPRCRLRVVDAMPLFDAILTGRLGPIAVDVQLHGHTRLLHHPQQFEAALQAYEVQSVSAAREALSCVQPFFMLCRTAEQLTNAGTACDTASLPSAPVLYTMDPSNHYPVLPLLAQLLRSTHVMKLLLHSRLLYRLLFLFLGTDRVEANNVVDVPTCTELGQQLRPSVASLLCSTAQKQQPHSQQQPVECLSDIAAALPEDARRLLDHEARSLAQPPQTASKQQYHEQELADGTPPSSAAPRLVDSDDDDDDGAGSSSEDEWRAADNNGGSGSGGGGGGDGGRSASTLALEGEAADAVQLLRRLQPLAEQPLHHSRADDGHAHVHEAGVKRRAQQQQQQQRRHRRIEGRVPPPGRSAIRADVVTLADVHRGLRAVTLLYHHVLAVLVDPHEPAATTASGDAAPRRNFGPSELAALRTHTLFLCELMSYHGLLLNDSATHAVLEELEAQRAAIADVGRRAAAALHAGAAGGVEDWTAELVQQSLARLPLGGRPTPQPNAVGVDLLRYLAREAKCCSGAEADALSLGCQLVCAWMAYADRVAMTNRLRDMACKVGDRVRVRVLERPRDAVDASSSVSARVCYSVHPKWELHNTSTGRVFSALPNVQNLSKLPPHTTFAVHALHTTHDGGAAPTTDDVDRWLALAEAGAAASSPTATRPLLLPEHPQWTLRHLYRAPPGCVLLAFDYNQLELRLLAHLSGDAALQAHLSANVDVLALVTATVLHLPSAAHVQAQQRQAVKVIVYGLLYGMGPELMDLRLEKLRGESAAAAHDAAGADPGARAGSAEVRDTAAPAPAPAPLSARDLLARFYYAYPRIKSYLHNTRQEALHNFTVATLSGVKSLASEADAGRRKQRAVALAVQGGAADVLQSAMSCVHRQRHTLLPFLPAAPLALVMSVHDELVYAVPRVAVDEVARGVQRVLEDQTRVLHLSVPLPVSVKLGPTLGDLTDYRPDGS
ncbi:DNA polymerase theta (polymerase domain only) [Novymonas esmeraldas]|uniref:DNA polymerase theta (Polymerase domain only) n=1 Tax=Novymonas esmeraldas TaxID=1808958 RepID=A0AAW0EKJ7_9TRYP